MSEPREIEEIRSRLQRCSADLSRMHVRALSVFGSRARGDARSDSDLDMLVEFSRPVGLIHFTKVRNYLSAALGRDVDLVTEGGLHPALKGEILHDARQVA
jgi:predicted nucleotidyltransferase